MKQYIKWFAAIVIVGALAGCGRTAPIDQIYATVSPGYTQEQVKKAILIAGVQREWVMTEAGPGVIMARQQSRNHIAEVRITYTATSYTIKYDSSYNLRASGGHIHKIYNRWVRNLDKDIKWNLVSNAWM